MVSAIPPAATAARIASMTIDIITAVVIRVMPISKTKKPIREGIRRETPDNDPPAPSIIESGIVIIWHRVPDWSSIPIRIAEPIGVWVIAVIIVDNRSLIGVVDRLIIEIGVNRAIALGVAG